MLLNPRQIYEILPRYATQHSITEVCIGLTWSYCATDSSIGLAMSPMQQTRILPWSGTLRGQTVAQFVNRWLMSWQAHEATLAQAAINAVINHADNPLLQQAVPLVNPQYPNLAVFEHFLPQLHGKKVVVVGRYPNLEHYSSICELTVLERQPSTGDLPDTACEYVLPQADWVFLTATSLPNKTFPRLVELSQSATVVLMGATLPWISEFKQMGIHYLAGVSVQNSDLLKQTVAEGGGTRIFEQAVQYRVLDLSAI